MQACGKDSKTCTPSSRNWPGTSHAPRCHDELHSNTSTTLRRRPQEVPVTTITRILPEFYKKYINKKTQKENESVLRDLMRSSAFCASGSRELAQGLFKTSGP